MHRPCLALFLALALSSAARAHAQAGPMSGHGSAVKPAPTHDVSLHALSTELSFDADAEAFLVTTRYELQNHSKREVRLQLGLPEARCDSDDDEDTDCSDPSSFRFESLETLVRGTAVQHRKARLAADHEWAPVFAGIWLFDVRLKPDERVPVEHRYQVPAGPAAGSGMNVALVTRTNGLWAAPVDRATFTFSIPAYSCLVVEPEHITRRKRRVELREQEPWLQLTYAAQRWAPRSDLGLYFETCVVPRDTELKGCTMLDALARFAYPPAGPDEEQPALSRAELKALLVKLDTTELKRCASAVFDAYASYYNQEELAVLASRPSAKRHFTAPLLTPADWQWVGLVDEVLNERKRNAPAAPKPAAGGGMCAALPGRASNPGAQFWLPVAALFAFRSRRLRARPRAVGNRT